MEIIIRFILKNIREKKFRTFLIVFSIIISSALFFASSAVSDTMVRMFEDRIKNYYGSAEIVIYPMQKSPSPYFTLEAAWPFRDKFEYAVGIVQGSGTYKHKQDETISISLVGADYDEFQAMNPIAFESQKSFSPFEGKKIVLSKNTSDKYGLKLGDSVELTIGGNQYRFVLSAIAQPAGLFFDDGMSTYAIVPVDVLASIYNCRGKYNMINIKLKDPGEKPAVISELSKAYDRYTVREPISREELKQQTQGMSTSFMLMAFIVTMMSIFIIYTSFKVVTMERLPVIGTFRSIGATRKMTDFVLLAESVLYGIVGGIIGCILGIGILYLMAVATRPVWVKGFKAAIEFTPLQLGAAFVFAVVLSFISCILPILRVSRIPVKDIVLNSIDKTRKRSHWKLLAALVFIAFTFTAPALSPKQLVLPAGIMGMVLSVWAVVLLVPYLISLLIKPLEGIFMSVFGNEGLLAVKNLRDNKSIQTNISLLAIGISSLLMINTISFSVVTELTSFYSSATFDVWVLGMSQIDRATESGIAKIDGVKEVYSVYEAYQVEVGSDGKNMLGLVQGVDRSKFLNYWNMEMSEDPDKLLDKLEAGRNIILTYSQKDKLGVREGDSIDLKMKTGSKSFTVVGFVSTLRNNGSYALVSEKYVKPESESSFYSNIFIKTNKNPEEVANDIQKKFARRHPFVRTVKQMEVLEQQSNASTFLILKGFSILALVIGIFGVLNNLIISFIERKRSLGMMRSVGMSRRQTVRMIFSEALASGLLGGVTGLFAGYLMLWGVPYVLKSINLSVPLSYPVDTLWTYVLAGTVITMAASVSPAISSSRLNIIEAVKYE